MRLPNPNHAVCVWLCAVTLAAQEQRAPTFRVSSDLVIVDLVASDQKGRFVSDLRADEIQVLESGKPQKVQFVHLIGEARAGDAGPQSPDAGRLGLPNSAPATSRADQADPLRVAVIVDLASTPVQDMPRVQDAIVRMASEELPGDVHVLVASVAPALTIHQWFTNDRARIAAAARALPVPRSHVGLAELLEQGQQSCALSGLPPLPQLVSMAKAMILETRQQVAGTSASLGVFARGLAFMPGRKHLVLYTRGYPFDATSHAVDLIGAAAAACGGDPVQLRRAAAAELSGLGGSDAIGAVRSLADQANRSQVSFYAIDPRGLATAFPDARQDVSAKSARSGQLTRAAAIEATLPQEYLRVVAAETGGRAFLNTNDLRLGLRRAWGDAAAYYLIGYTPAAGRRKGRYQQIDVKVSRPGLDLRFRRGYHEATDKERQSADIESALRSPSAFEHAGLDVEATVERDRLLRVIAYVPPGAITFSRLETREVAELTVHGTLRDSAGKLVGGKSLFGKDVTLRLTDQQVAALRRSDNAEIPVDVSAPPPGRYQLTVVARDRGGWIGAKTIDVNVPK
jgi:VWFA-related protein